MRKYRLTGCARFLIFLLIATPIAYFAASYYNNQNPIQVVKTWFVGSEEQEQTVPPVSAAQNGKDTADFASGIDSTEIDETTDQPPASSPEPSGNASLLKLIEQKEHRIEELIRENERLRNELERAKTQE